MIVPSNTQDLILSVHLVDDGGSPIAGQAFNTAGLVVSYRLESASAYTTLTLVDGTVGTYLANSWKEVGLGEYQLCLPNSALAPGNETNLKIVVGSNAPLFDSVQARLPIGSGTGERTVTFTVSSADTVIPNSRITVMYGEGVVATGVTNAIGRTTLYLTDGAYIVKVASSPMYVNLPNQALTVTEDSAVSYVLTAVGIPSAAAPDMCSVRFYVRRCGQPVLHAKVTVTAVGINLTLDKVLLDRCELSGLTNSDGYVDLSLIHSSQFTRGGRYEIDVLSPRGCTIHKRMVRVPDADTAFAEDLPDA